MVGKGSIGGEFMGEELDLGPWQVVTYSMERLHWVQLCRGDFNLWKVMPPLDSSIIINREHDRLNAKHPVKYARWLALRRLKVE